MTRRRKTVLTVLCVIVFLVLAGWAIGGHQLTKLFSPLFAIIYPEAGDLFQDMDGYKVSFSADEMYSIENFALHGKYSDLAISRGILIPGTMEVGVTVVVVLGDGEWIVRDPGQYIWKNLDKQNIPFRESFSSIYLRIHPRFYQDLFESATTRKIEDIQAFKKAEKIYKHKFWNSYHVNDRAIIPSADMGMIDIESNTWGRLQIGEGMQYKSMTMPPQVTKWDYKGDPPWYMD